MGNPYLLGYNTVLCLGWSYCFLLTAKRLTDWNNAQLWAAVEIPLKIFQTAAFAEIIHSIIGLVRSPVMVTTMQVFSRIWIVWGIINPVKYATTTQSIKLFNVGDRVVGLGLVSLILAWSVSEIIRYGYFALKEIEIDSYLFKWLRYTGFILLYPLGVSSELSLVYIAMPFIKTSLIISFAFFLVCLIYHEIQIEFAFLTWLRYSMFLPLYPIGVFSELALVYFALPEIRRLQLWSISMPNTINFAFSYYIYVIGYSSLYLPCFPQLYFYMFAQRKKVLGRKSESKTE